MRGVQINLQIHLNWRYLPYSINDIKTAKHMYDKVYCKIILFSVWPKLMLVTQTTHYQCIQ